MRNENSLTGRTALVTGAAKRIGRACALALAGAGADIVIHYNTSKKETEALAGEISAMGRKAWTIQADLRNEEQTGNLFEQAREKAGIIDILVNSASLFTDDTAADMSWDALDESIRLHAYAPLVLGRLLAAQDKGGDIVNFLDSRVNDYDSLHFSYHLGKRSLFTVTRAMSIEFAPAVKVNAIAPGLILPPPGRDDSYLKKLKDTNPLKKTGTLDDICGALLMLVENSFITGQVIFVDGGRHLKGQTYGI